MVAALKIELTTQGIGHWAKTGSPSSALLQELSRDSSCTFLGVDSPF